MTDTYANLAAVTQEGEVKQLPMGDLYADVGATGLNRSAGVIDEEFMPALKGQKSVKVFREMSMNDPMVGSLLFTIEMLLRQVEWTVVGASSKPEQAKAVKFLEECMDDMSHSWSDLIAEILSCMTYGWSWHEIVYKKRVGPWEIDPKKRSKFTDGKVGWRKMPIRGQETLHRWIFDEDGGVKGMIQMAPPLYKQEPLNINRSLLFRTGAHKGNPEGRSILRNAYRPWYFKKRLEEFEAIGVERDLAGMPVARVPSALMKGSATPAEKQMYQAFKKMVANVRRDEHEGLVIPSDVDAESKARKYEFELMASGGSRTFNTNELIQRYELNILTVVLADFLKLGHEGSGSYAMHVDKTGIFRAALNTYAKNIADTFNRYAIPRLFQMNNWKLDELPRIEPSNVDPPNLSELTQFMTGMAGLGMTFFPDPDLEKFLRETAHLPSLPEEVEEMRRQMAEQQNAVQFMQSDMEAKGMAQQEEMVAGGMHPMQAEMAAQQPTPEMQAQDPQAQAAQQKAGLDQQAAEQKLKLEGASAQQGLKQQEAEGAQRIKQGEMDLQLKQKQMQLEIDQMQARLGMENEGARAKLDNDKKAQVFSLEAKRKQAQVAAQKPKPAPAGNARKTRQPVRKSDNPFRRH